MHSAAAELFFHALYAESDVVEDLAGLLREYFVHEMAQARADTRRLKRFVEQLGRTLTIKPVLLSHPQLQQSLARCLASPEFLPGWRAAALTTGNRALLGRRARGG